MPRRYHSRIGLLESSPPPAQLDPTSETLTEMGYPRPQLRRDEWFSLDGMWDFEIETEPTARAPDEIEWSSRILVPFSPETPQSGIGDTGLYRACWYRRTFPVPKLAPHERLLLHFGAADYHAIVWVNGARLGEHEGGYSPFHFDITPHLDATRAEQTVIVHVDDDPTDLEKPRGKQDWQLDPHSIWYPRTTGIWQTVWLERVPEMRITQLTWTTNVERWEIGLDASLSAPTAGQKRSVSTPQLE
jgi:beta-galactosidase/beta-glucuronidase